MPTAKRLPSGSWRCQVYAGKDDSGKRQYKSFTASTKKEAELMAAQFSINKEVFEDKNNPLFKDAMAHYNEVKSNVLSPATIRGYCSLAETAFPELLDIPIMKIDSNLAQQWVNRFSLGRSPKTVRNASGYLQAVLGLYNVPQRIDITLPQKKPVDYHVVTDEELSILLKHCNGNALGIAVALAAFVPARRSEICALTYADIDRKKNTVTINKAMVEDENSQWVIKVPKTYSSYRVVALPKEIIDMIPQGKPKDRIMQCTPNSLANRFRRALKTLKMDFRFHDLRHYGATFLYAQADIPIKEIMSRGGWQNSATLENIYSHTLPEFQKAATEAVSAKFNSVIK
jgi:integrase